MGHLSSYSIDQLEAEIKFRQTTPPKINIRPEGCEKITALMEEYIERLIAGASVSDYTDFLIYHAVITTYFGEAAWFWIKRKNHNAYVGINEDGEWETGNV